MKITERNKYYLCIKNIFIFNTDANKFIKKINLVTNNKYSSQLNKIIKKYLQIFNNETNLHDSNLDLNELDSLFEIILMQLDYLINYIDNIKSNNDYLQLIDSFDILCSYFINLFKFKKYELSNFVLR